MCLRANADCTTSGDGSTTKQTRGQNASADSSTRKRGRNHSVSDTARAQSTRHTQRADTVACLQAGPVLSDDLREAQDDDEEVVSTMSMARKLYSLGEQHIDEVEVNAIPGAAGSEVGTQATSITLTAAERIHSSSILTYPLPPLDIVDELLEEYFASIHWFSLVVHEPKFRFAFTSIQDQFIEPNQRPFLILVSTMLGMAAWYRSQKPEAETGRSSRVWKQLSSDLVKNADNDIINIMDQNSIPAIQTLVLLGSYYCYHGRPNLSFSLLGASIRASQALGLHRQVSRISLDDSEERKRVWWTIYTWDM